MKKKEVPAATLLKEFNDIVKIIYSDKIKIDIHHVKELDAAFSEFIDNKPVHTISDFSGRYFVFTNEAQKFLASDAEVVKRGLIKSSALIVDNLPNRLLARFFMSFFKPDYPVKVVKSYEEGMKWIAELKDN